MRTPSYNRDRKTAYDERCPHGNSNPGLSLERASSWATRRWGRGGTTTTISQIFHHLVFPAETISEALAGIFDKAADKEVRAMSEEVAQWTLVIGEIVQAPSSGDYSKVAQSSLPVAAALAPALFLLRLALYHWGRLLGDDDSGLRVVGDWVTAGVLQIASPLFLKVVHRAKDFIDAVDLVAGVSGDFAQNAGLGEFNILSGGREGRTYAF